MQAGTIQIIQEGTEDTNNGIYKVSVTSTNRFDDVMRAHAPANTTVHLAPGTYQTWGLWIGGMNQTTPPGFRVQNNMKILGESDAGGNKPVLKLIEIEPFHTNQPAPQNVVLGTGGFNGLGNIVISNLVINCNAFNLTNRYGRGIHLKGVEITGTNVSLIDLDVIGASNERVIGMEEFEEDITETFILGINAPTEPEISQSNLIKRCTVSQFNNPDGLGLCSAISLNYFPGTTNHSEPGYIMGRVEDCAVTLNGGGGEFAYNAHRSVSAFFHNNKATNAARGFNNDTPYNFVPVFSSNSMRLPPRTASGFLFVNDTSWSRVYDNHVRLDLSGANAFVASGPYWTTNGTNVAFFKGAANMLFDHNSIEVGTSYAVTSYGFSLRTGLDTNNPPAYQINVENNQLDSRLANVAPASVGYYFQNTNATYFPQGLNLGWRYTPCRADLNLDGMVDLVFQDAGYYMKTWFMSNNGARVSEVALTPNHPGSGWKVVGSGDINRDGRTDLFFQYFNGDLGYWMLSDTFLTSGGVFPSANRNPGGTWKVAGVGDFNNDNKPDLLFQDDEGFLAVWFMDGINRTSSAWLDPNNSGSSKRRAVGTGDFNQDGKVDVLFQYDDENDQFEDARLTVWLMDGVTRSTNVFPTPNPPEDRSLRVVATGEFGTLGGSPSYHDDIVFQQRNSTNIQAWFMDGIDRVTTNSAPLTVDGSYRVVGPK